ncbi:MAG: phosphate acyltransferase PlsX, partial [Burkholderiales bacterium]
MTVTVALDCMGGDYGASVTVPAALGFLEKEPEAGVILVGQPAAIEAELNRYGAAPGNRLRLQAAAEVVAMDEPPAQALRGKRD